MRIISKFHDYYDGPATMFGQEPVFVRNTNMPANMWPKVQMYLVNSFHNNGKETKYGGLIVFCGKTYHLEYLYDNKTGKYLMSKQVEETNWTREIIKHYIEKYPQLSTEPIWTLNWGNPYYVKKYGEPVYITNPVLRDYDFAKVLDPYTAAQELDMYLSNLAVKPEHEPLPVDDKTKIESHGFDYKKSFRKEKK